MNFITIILSLYITISISAPRYLSEEFIEKMNNRIKVHERNNKFAATVVSLQNLTPRQAFEKGILAYNNKNYVEALPLLKKAVQGGISEAYEPLIHMYAHGDYDGSGKGNYSEALRWTAMAINTFFNMEEGAGRKQLYAVVMSNYGPLCFLVGDYKEAIDHMAEGLKNGRFPKDSFLMNVVAASYYKLGNVRNAKEFLKMATETNSKNDYDSHVTNAILSKIYFDKQDYTNALILSEDAAKTGKVPLAAYVYGASLIKTNNHPNIGKQWVQAAAQYNYSGIIEINCFDNEIKQYWYTIRDISY